LQILDLYLMLLFEVSYLGLVLLLDCRDFGLVFLLDCSDRVLQPSELIAYTDIRCGLRDRSCRQGSAGNDSSYCGDHSQIGIAALPCHRSIPWAEVAESIRRAA
jgi:hypothetical protein